jgi:magnesium chelatase accessory protein
MSDAPDWSTDGAGWPNRVSSRFVQAAGLRWHVQIAGAGPVLLLLHGTGAATHSWSGLFPLLSQTFTVVAPDLPGHGFTQPPPAPRMTLPAIAAAIAALLEVLALPPAAAAGHSAGAAILIRLCLDGAIIPQVVFSLNGALLPPQSRPLTLLAPLVRLASASSLLPRLFAWHAADRRVVDRLMDGTGSAVPPEQRALYLKLARRSSHAGAALAMMAHWDLASLLSEMQRLTTKLVMINGANDRLIPQADAERIRALRPSAELISLPRLGHLAHEEAPAQVAALIQDTCRRMGILA